MLGVLLLAAAAPALDFDRVFGARGEPAALHFRARYQAAGGTHDVEVWRDGDRRLKRVTDVRLTTLVTREQRGDDYRLDLLDQARRIHTTISRESMYRIGGFTDWFDMAHALRHPRAAYRLTVGDAPGAMPATPAPCRWYDLGENGRMNHICWDAADRLPLLIVGGAALAWRVTAIDRKPIATNTFTYDDGGFVRTNADRDIAAD